MGDKIVVAILDGSSRKESETRKLAKVTAKKIEELGAEVLLFDQSKNPLPLFDGDNQWLKNDNVELLFSTLAKADAVVLSSPEYHGSMSSTIKNALDWLSMAKDGEVLEGKVVGLIGGGGGLANSGATLQLMMAVRAMHGWLMPDVVLSVSQIWDAFDLNQGLSAAGYSERLHNFAQKLVTYAHIFKQNRPTFLSAA